MTLIIIVSVVAGAILGWFGWHLYYLRLLPVVAKRFGYNQRGKRIRHRKPPPKPVSPLVPPKPPTGSAFESRID